MNDLMLAATRLAHSPQASGVARFVAPTNGLGRVGSALALTALLAGVQLGLVSGHAGLTRCQLSDSGCASPAPVAGGRLLEGPTPAPARRVIAHRPRKAPLLQTAASVHLLTATTAHPPAANRVRPSKADRSRDPGCSAVPEQRRAAKVHGQKKSLGNAASTRGRCQPNSSA